MSLLAELKRRNVLKVSAAYLALGWVVVEVTNTVTPLLNLPARLPTVVLWIGIIGFPFVAAFAWVYELTPDGLRREDAAGTEGGSPAPRARRTARRLDYLIFALVALAIALFAYDRFGQRPAGVPSAPAVAEAGSQAQALDERPAIAVLPFDNLSSDPEQAFFADGLAEDLITRLASWRAFPVIARNSSFQYRGGNVDLSQVSTALGARYLVQGSVRRADDRIRVTAQLTDTKSGEHVWVDTYDGEIADVFALQDELSGRIAAALVGDLNRAEAERAQQRGTENLEAWSLYQLGLQSADRYSREGFAAARERFTAAAARDPAAQAALGWAYVMSGDIDNGLTAARRAVALNPSMPEAWGWLSWNLLVASDAKGCIEAALRAQRLNPLGSMSSIVNDNLSQAYWQLGDYDAGLRAARRLLAELPEYFLGHVFVAMNAVGLGRLDEARAAIEEARRAYPDLSLEFVQGMYGVARPEIDARRNSALRQAGLE
jgi:TolB-like protein